ncbi:hypothetical protein KSP40_PGU003156 [Platanthera guangdongensis]|uniref:ATP-dependent helicase C-terminal domain-containing protein n=1 Tax=Platanthera guangdongensis TaxID=2320717 RepID=A0ABR2MGE1_9ASPA
MITGMPFSMRTDPKVRLKREYMDQQAILRMKDSKDVLTGENWYVQQAARAVNQAIGRVIRHRHDYGAIILCDERFAQQNYQCQISFWLRSYVKCYPKFGDAVYKITKFFRERGTPIPQKPKLIGSLASEKIVMDDRPIFTSNFLSCLSPSIKHIPREIPATLFAVSKEKVHSQLRHIIPANHSNLFFKQNQNFSTSNRRGKLCFSIADETDVDSINHENEVVDLTTNTSDDKRMRRDDVLTPCLVKLPKIPKLINQVPNCTSVDRENCCKQSFLSSCSRLEAEGFGIEKRVGNIVSSIDICKDQAATSVANDNSVLKKIGQNCLSTHGKELSRGSSFLSQVQGRLTSEEYNEFVSLMRALKSKAAKITSVLDSIMILFSSPGRLFLLKGFKEFVPEKYQSLYEQHLKAHHVAADGN